MSRDSDHGRVGMRAFFEVAKLWELNDIERLRLLGQSDEDVIHAWANGECPDVSKDTLERISYILGIFRAINTLLPIPERADAWMRKPNQAPIFAGRSALDRMTDGEIEDLKIVREYLDAEASPLDYPNRMFGVLKNKIDIPDDFDELPDDLINTMEGR